jgi:adenylosuccinate synthase
MEEIHLKPTVKEFYNDKELISEVEKLSSQGISKKNLYVLSHDDDRTERVADNANANEIGARETGIGTAVGNMIVSKGDELRNQLQEMGFSKEEADQYEEKLDEGKILLLVQD